MWHFVIDSSELEELLHFCNGPSRSKEDEGKRQSGQNTVRVLTEEERFRRSCSEAEVVDFEEI